jgi:Predicted transcriptional regulators
MKKPTDTPYPLSDLCSLADVPPRTVRYYIQIGLVDKPSGSTRAATYGPKHLEQLLLIKKWTAAGVSLERIRELLQGAEAPVPPRPFVAGAVEVRSHLTIADGVEVVIEPGRAGLSPEQVRQFTRAVMAAFDVIKTSPNKAGDTTNQNEQEQY